MALQTFNDNGHILWHSIDAIPHLQYSILDMDPQRHIVDVLFKFAANKQIVLHRHVVQNNMLVIQGEHRIYDATGQLQEVRPLACYTSSPPKPEPHREGGGDQDAIVFFSIRGAEPVYYEILDDKLDVVASLGWQDFSELYSQQHRQIFP